MDNIIPKINLIYYKNILDNVLCRFFEDCNGLFSKDGDLYVFSGRTSRTSLKKILTAYFIEELGKVITDYDVLKPNYYFVIGSCLPCDNMLLSHLSDERIPKKLKLFIRQHPSIKYVLNEHDIKIDFEMFNGIFEEIFNGFFGSRKKVLDSFGKNKTNLRFIKYENLDCYSLYRMVKDMFGKINVVNLHRKNLDNMKNVMRSLNEVIGSYVLKKKEICRDRDLDMVRREIRAYIENCIAGNI